MLLGVLVFATLTVYLPARNHPFLNIDDDDYLTNNAHVKAGLEWETVTWAFTTYDAANWHPLTWLSHALDVQLFQLDPEGHHEVNLLLHALNVVLLFWVLWRATGYPGRSLMVAALFALHPVNVESVVWVAERKTLLSMSFFLLALGAHGWYAGVPQPSRRRREAGNIGRYLVVLLLFSLGLMAKPQIITFPFVLLLWDYWPLRRMALRKQALADATPPPAILPQRSFWWLVTEKLPLFALSAASAIITLRAQRLGGGLNTDISFSHRLANAIVSYARYLGQAFWPAHLAVFYPQAPLRAWQVWASAILLLGITGFVVGYSLFAFRQTGEVAKRDKRNANGEERIGKGGVLVGWLWFLGTLVPMIGLVQVGRQAMADRYAYLPFVGLFIMLVWGAADCTSRLHWSPAWQAGVSVAVLLVLTALTHRQINFWDDNVRLWTHTLEVTRGNYLAEDNLGRALEAEGRQQEAMLHFARSAEIEPSYVFAHIHLGTNQQLQGDLQGALWQYRTVIGLTQNDLAHYAEVQHLIFDNMAAAYAKLGEWTRARQCLESALALNPDNAEEWTNLGIVAQTTGEMDRAIEAYSEAVKLQPTPRGFQLLARALQQAGRQQEAQAAMQKAVSSSQ